MKRLHVLSMLVISVLLVSLAPVQAQSDLEYAVTFPDGVTVSYPEGWEVSEDDDEVMLLQNESTGLYIFLYSLYDLEDAGVEPGDAAGILEVYHSYNTTDESDPFDADKLTSVTIDEREIIYFEPLIVEGDSQYGVLQGAMVLDDTGRMVTFGAYPREGDAVVDTEIILDMVASARTGVYYLGDGTLFYYPPEWDSYVDEDAYIRMESPTLNVRIEFFSPETLAEMEAGTENLIPVLESGFESANDKTLVFDPAAVAAFTAGDFPGMEYLFTDTYEGESYDRLLLVATAPEGWVNLFDIAPLGTTITEEEKAEVIDILASFEPPVD